MFRAMQPAFILIEGAAQATAPAGRCSRMKSALPPKTRVALSELILMNVLATGTVMASLIAREYGFIPDISTLLICITAVFLLTLCWTYQIRIMNLRLAFREAGRRVDYRARLARRMASYALFFIIFAWFFALIAAKHGLL